MATSRQLAFACLLVYVTLGCQNLSSQQGNLNIPDIVSRSSDAVVQIVVSDSLGQPTALGSGFVISQDGRIVTNYHVIKGAHTAIVKLTNGSFFPVDGVLAADPDKDLAILKVAGKNLPFLSLETSQLRVGDRVVAIGSPLGLDGTVSDGIVSAIREEDNKTWIQTTAPVSHGNSGGPLLDLKGNVTGVITWGVNLNLGQNLNFAVAANEVGTLLGQLHSPAPLDSVGNEYPSSPAGTTHDTALGANGAIWTSVMTGHDYRLRRENDHIYTEWVNLPKQLSGTMAFVRSDLKLQPGGKWSGEVHSNLPCAYKDPWSGREVVKWCSVQEHLEIDLLSDKRIEGIGSTWEKFECRKCEAKGTKEAPFTWIPKD